MPRTIEVSEAYLLAQTKVLGDQLEQILKLRAELCTAAGGSDSLSNCYGLSNIVNAAANNQSGMLRCRELDMDELPNSADYDGASGDAMEAITYDNRGFLLNIMEPKTCTKQKNITQSKRDLETKVGETQAKGIWGQMVCDDEMSVTGSVNERSIPRADNGCIRTARRLRELAETYSGEHSGNNGASTLNTCDPDNLGNLVPDADRTAGGVRDFMGNAIIMLFPVAAAIVRNIYLQW